MTKKSHWLTGKVEYETIMASMLLYSWEKISQEILYKHFNPNIIFQIGL